ncbi:MAG: hypothetical protein ACE5EJ_04960 [Nitrosopumilaceae archaeon]
MLKLKLKPPRKPEHEGDDVQLPRKVEEKGEKAVSDAAVRDAVVSDVVPAVRDAVVSDVAVRDVEAAVRKRVALEGVDDDDKLPSILFFQLNFFRLYFKCYFTFVLHVSKYNVSKLEFRNIIKLYS